MKDLQTTKRTSPLQNAPDAPAQGMRQTADEIRDLIGTANKVFARLKDRLFGEPVPEDFCEVGDGGSVMAQLQCSASAARRLVSQLEFLEERL